MQTYSAFHLCELNWKRGGMSLKKKKIYSPNLEDLKVQYLTWLSMLGLTDFLISAVFFVSVATNFGFSLFYFLTWLNGIH